MQTITPLELKALIKANALKRVEVIGEGAELKIRINEAFTLIKARSGNQLRGNPEKTYASPNQLFKFLHGLGITSFDVDVTNWQDEKQK